MVFIENDTNTGINVWKWHFCGDAYMMLKYMDAPITFFGADPIPIFLNDEKLLIPISFWSNLFSWLE